MKNVLVWLGIPGLFAVGIVAVLFFSLLLYVIFGPLYNQANYNIFNNSPQHVNAVIQHVSSDCGQLVTDHDSLDRKAIEHDIVNVVATIDLNKAEMPDNVRTCIQQAMQDVGP